MGVRGPVTRAPLPDDAANLPDLPPAARRLIETGCAAWGVALEPPQLAALEAHARLLLAWTTSINLTAVRRPEHVAVRHVLDSLSAVPLLRRAIGARPRLADIGSGGGYPGLPLAIVLPASQAVLIESVGKKARFLEVASAAVSRALDAAPSAPAFVVEPRRAEALAGRDGRPGAFDVVTARAVGSLARLAELGLPLLRPGGVLIAWKRDGGDGALQVELQEARSTVARLGGGAPRVEPVPVPPGTSGLEGHRLVVIEAGAAAGSASARGRLLG